MLSMRSQSYERTSKFTLIAGEMNNNNNNKNKPLRMFMQAE